MGTFTAMVRSLSAKLAELEHGATCQGDWIRLHAAVMRVAITAREQVAGMCSAQRETMGELIDELRYIKICAEAELGL